ncbi:MAG: FAD-dependent oxidoreductase [Oscillospiraceae bacterium]|nr:FAD-dependent oxidoreductase [Oscillospiraceae bacterium]
MEHRLLKQGECLMYDTIIIGAGAAGITAGIYAKRAGLNVIVLEKMLRGGQIVNAPSIENYPGFITVTGAAFASAMYEQAQAQGVQFAAENAIKFDITAEKKRVITNKRELLSQSVIIAVGASHKRLGCEGEDTFAGKGVSYCPVCDGTFFSQTDVCIVGGGNSALVGAEYLAKICKTVYLVHRREEFRASKAAVDAVKSLANVKLILGNTIERIQGENRVSRIVLSKETEKNKELEVNAVFVSVGQEPQTAAFKDILEMDENGYIIAGEDCKTDIPGVFAAGDCRTKPLRQLVTAAADGAVAALECVR